MEAALASVALAGNIIQFIGVARSIVSRGVELKRSHDGRLKEHKEILTVVADLDTWLSKLDVDCNDTLQSVVDDCKDVAGGLKNALMRASKNRHVWSHCKEAVASVWNKKQIEDTEKRLTRLSDEISHHLQATMRRDVGTILEHVQQQETQLKEVQIEIHDLAGAQADSVTTLQSHIEDSKNAIISHCESSLVHPAELHPMLRELHGLCTKIVADSTIARQNEETLSPDRTSRDAFINTFTFWGMDDREESISKAHARTCEWIIMDPEDYSNNENQDSYHQERLQLHRDLLKTFSELGLSPTKKYPFHFQVSEKHPTAHLQRWFASGKGVFWIWGKPGCGKSTLMKSILQTPKLKRRLKALLDSDASQTPGKTLIASFYFFRPGMTLQKSETGLLLSLLFQIFRARPSLITKVYSLNEQDQAVARHERRKGSDEPIWTVAGLRRALRNLVEQEDLKLYLHIDGIDEIDCSPLEIARLLCKLAEQQNVKILAAGRYHGEFKQMFPKEQSLNLHELTEIDILRFTVDELRQSPVLKILDKPQHFVDVIKEITSSAQGVFQWVKIVIDSLIQGLSCSESFERLFKRLKKYPKDLDDLYQFLYNCIEEENLPDTAFWLLYVLRYTTMQLPKGMKRHLTTRGIWIAEHVAAGNDNVLRDLKRMEPRERVEVARKTQSRMQAQGRHFFDFGPRSSTVKKVSFAHRTVLDFLVQKNKQIAQQLESHIPPTCDYVFAQDVGLSDSHTSFSKHADLELIVFIFETRGFETAQKSWPRITDLFDGMFYRLDTERVLSPTATGWAIETRLAKYHRLNELLHPALSYSLASYHHGFHHELYRDMDKYDGRLYSFLSSLNLMRLSETQRELLLLAQICCRSWSSLDLSCCHMFLRLSTLEIHLSQLFPGNVPHQSICLGRLIEWVRMLWGVFIARHESKVGHVFPHATVEAACSVVDAIGLLVSCGADPNLLCRNVATDPDKSHLSVMTVLSRMKYQLPDLIHHDKQLLLRETLSREGVACQQQDAAGQTLLVTGLEQFEKRLEHGVTKALEIAEEKGGRERVITCEVHQESDIPDFFCGV